MEFLWNTVNAILGVPGAASGDDAVFLGESLLQDRKSPWVLIITEPVPDVLEFRPLIQSANHNLFLLLNFLAFCYSI